MVADDVKFLESKVNIPNIITMVTIVSTAATHGKAGMLNLSRLTNGSLAQVYCTNICILYMDLMF